jgi:hypothetical protein
VTGVFGEAKVFYGVEDDIRVRGFGFEGVN